MEGVMKRVHFEWYVLNEGLNRKEVGPYNIFNNIIVLEETNKLCANYKKKNMTFKEFTEELRAIIMWQEWSRCEYEIVVGGVFSEIKDYQKIDCYEQVLPNIKIIARYVLEEYYPRLKINLRTGRVVENIEVKDCQHSKEEYPPPHTCDICTSLDEEDYCMWEKEIK